MSFTERYEAVIGLEIHAQLSTQSKLFCGDAIAFGAAPNTLVSPVSLAHPGTLPRMNKKAVEYAVKMGLACNCTIQRYNFFARKNYFYPDLPKGYQVSQHTVPICTGGYVTVMINGTEKQAQLNRIHLEEDAGKSIHDIDPDHSCIDHNRAGTPLIEIVTEPCIRSAEEAGQYLATVKKLVQWLEICDGNMEQGNLRCDANISIRPKGARALGTKVEVKNLNSIRNLRKAIEYEIVRMSEMLDRGETIIQQTRSFDAGTDTTFALREKEEANDYRYFPDPDLAPIVLTEKDIDIAKDAMPELPGAVTSRLQEQFGLGPYDAAQLTESKEFVEYYLELVRFCSHYKAAANWMNGPVRQYLNEHDISIVDVGLSPDALASLVEIVENGSIGFSAASSRVFPAMVSTGKQPADIISEMGLQQVSEESLLNEWIQMALDKMPDKIAEYKKGKKGLIGLFVGEVKKLSKGTADPKLVSELLEQKLNN